MFRIKLLGLFVCLLVKVGKAGKLFNVACEKVK